MAGYIGNKAVGINVTTGDILGDVGVGGVVTANGGAVFNEGSVDVDFRVESVDGQHSLFVEGSTGNIGMFGDAGVQTIDHFAGYTTLTLGNTTGGTIQFEDDGVKIAQIFSTTANMVIENTKSDGDIQIKGTDGGASITALTLDMSAGGHATLNNGLTLTDGNLIVAAGHGINFSAQTSANSVTGVTTADELLDHYEEGTWTPLLPSGGTVGTIIKCIYTRIGNLVNVYGNVFLNPTNNNTIFYIAGLPYASTGNNSHGMGTIGYSGGADVSFFGSSLVDGSSRIYYHRNNASTDTAKNSFAGGANRQMVFQAAYLI